MRSSPDLLRSTCSWPYKSIELSTTFSWKGDMAEKDNPTLLPEVHTTTITNKSPNVSTDSGFECEKGTLHRDALSSDEVSLSLWTKESNCDRLDTQQSSCPCSPQSPLKHLDDSDFNESPLEKRTLGSFSIDSDSVFQGDESTEKCCVDDLPVSPSQTVPSCRVVPSVLVLAEGQEQPSEPQSDEPVLHLNNQNVSVHSMTSHINPVQSLEIDYQPSETCLSQAEQSCDETYSDEALSTYYVPSSVSVAMDDMYSQSSSKPPQSSGLLRRGETCSEADASEPSRKCHGTYKSLRSQSDPSTHYTTVLKPIAIKPDPVNVDRVEFRSSMESLHLGQISAALVRYQNRRSAFREHLRSTLSQCEGVNLLFSRSLGTPPPSGSPVRNYIDINRGTPHSSPIQLTPTRACSLNDVTNDSHFQCSIKLASSSTSLQPEMCLAHSSNSSKSSGCVSGLMCSKRHSMPVDVCGTRKKSSTTKPEPIHMTLEEVRNSLQTLNISPDDTPTDEKKSPCRQFIRAYLRSRKGKRDDGNGSHRKMRSADKSGHRRSFPFSVKAAFSSLFGLKTTSIKSQGSSKESTQSREETEVKSGSTNTSPFLNRALPPLPIEEANLWGATVNVDEESSSLSASDSFSEGDSNHNRMRKMDYAASIEKVKDCGWYWGPISGETAEKLLVSEPDGSFVLRDSSDEHYIFSLTFKLNGLVRHVRIEHDHGNFSFGCLQKFRSDTIVDFIENAVEHSRSGRYLFFLHRRPILGPMRVQLLHPVSRFKQVQSLQHLCRFVILKTVRRDLIDKLPLPRRLKDYLNTPHYYSEELAHLPLPSSGQQPQQQQQQQQPASSSLLATSTNTTASQGQS